jgi:hypothetical protein
VVLDRPRHDHMLEIIQVPKPWIITGAVKQPEIDRSACCPAKAGSSEREPQTAQPGLRLWSPSAGSRARSRSSHDDEAQSRAVRPARGG